MDESIINTQDLVNVTNLCQEPETKGFDLQAGQTWIYPTNYPVRDYQYNIIEQALHKNTLVSLPTGLGKTFIAAVVMYNFYRWYPHGKIIFMAPTRPLVKQQIEACYDITAIPQEATAELTGTKGQSIRSDIWKEKRVFFITPQVLQNDLATIDELAEQIKCLVFDEAHKAKGNYAYCEVVRRLSAKSKLFRVLALSATPGNSAKDILEVGQNLLIAHLEFRTEDSADVKPYSFQRNLETVVVPLGQKLDQIRNDYILNVLEKYTRALINYKVINGNCANLTKGKIFMILREYKTKNRNNTHHYAEITKNLNICVTLYHAFEVLVRHGLRGFLNFFDEHISKPLLRGNQNLINIMDDVRKYLGPEPNVEPLTDGTFPELAPNTKFGHPKFYKLRDILLTHFQKNNDASTRVIVFFEYRESVMEAYALLLQSRPLLKPRVFLGQGSGITQKTQISVVKAFRQGDCNTLLSTSIGEEGLDVGEVDLIVCFDISNRSPIRMIQRMGRTGRKRDGRVVVLVTEGKEQQILKDCLVYKSNLGNFTVHNNQMMSELYANNPLMVPAYITPKCQKMHITVQKPVLKKNDNNLKAMFRSISSNVVTFADDLDMRDVPERLGREGRSFWDKPHPMAIEVRVGFKGSLEKQRMLQSVGSVQHSKQSEMLVSLLQFADSKRYNIPGTQIADLGQNMKQGDIRNMFSKATNILPSSSQDFRIPTSQNIPSAAAGNKSTDNGKFSPELLLEMANYVALQKALNETCKVCTELFECPKIFYETSNASAREDWIVPDISILDSITSDEIEFYGAGGIGDGKEIKKSPRREPEDIFSDTLDEVTFSEIENKQVDILQEEKSFTYEIPKSFSNILKSYSVTATQQDAAPQPRVAIQTTAAPQSTAALQSSAATRLSAEVLDCSAEAEILRFFKWDRIDDLFGAVDEAVEPEEVELFDTIEDVFGLTAEDSPKPTVTCVDEHKVEDRGAKDEKIEPEEVKLFDSIEDVFGLAAEDAPKPTVACVDEQNVISCVSPDMFETSDIEESPVVIDVESPVISSSSRSGSCAVKAKRKLFDDDVSKPDLKKLFNTPRSSFYRSKSNETIAEEAKKRPVEVSPEPTEVRPAERSFRNEPTIADICDFSSFGITQRDLEKNLNAIEKKKTEEAQVDLDISDVCDLSAFGITSSMTKTVAAAAPPEKVSAAEALANISDICDISCFVSDSSDFETSPSRNIDIYSRNITQRKTPVSSLTKPGTSSSGPKEQTARTQSSPTKETVSSLTKTKALSSGPKGPATRTQKSPNKQAGSSLTKPIASSSGLASPVKQAVSSLTKSKALSSGSKGPTTRTILSDSSDFELSPSRNIDIYSRNITQRKTPVSSLTKPGTSSSGPKEPTARTQSSPTKQAVSSLTKPKASSGPKQPTARREISPVKQAGSSLTKPKASSSVPKGPTISPIKRFLALNANSDDDFEDTSPVLSKKPKVAKPVSLTKSHSSRTRSKSQKKTTAAPLTKPKSKKKLQYNEYIEAEAVLSQDENVNVSTDELDTSKEDCFDSSFVEDDIDHIPNTQMHMEYLKSVRSPPVQRGKFKIPQRPQNGYQDVFSQPVHNEDDYEMDSFCVNTEEISFTQRVDELDELEAKLKKKKRKKKDVIRPTKRRRVIQSDESD